METSPANLAGEEVNDALVRSTLRDQARLMGKIKLPKRGITKSPLTGNGRFASESRARLRMARALRVQRRRWLRGDFTSEELIETQKMLEYWKDMLATKPTPSGIAQAVSKVFDRHS